MAEINKFEKKIHSQNGEDGIIDFIFSTIGTTNKFFVEFGVQKGIECNTKNLRETGWEGIMWDGRFEDHSINLYKHFITKDNVLDLFLKYDVPSEFDLLSIDIDGNDYHILKELKDYLPRVIIIEYNASLCHKDLVIPYHKTFKWDGTNYFGASFTALKKLLNYRGYAVVGCDKKGVNMFAVHNCELSKFDDIIRNEFNSSILYNPPKYGPYLGGHRKDQKNREYITSEV